MTALARARLEALLQTHRLARTIVTPGAALPLERLPTDVAPLDRLLGGGLPRGELSELVGPRSSGRLAVAAAALAAATARGELAALIDALDTFDPAAGHAAGIVLERLLWVRGSACGPCVRRGGDLLMCTLERAVRATELVLQAGGFGLVVLDVGEVPARALRRLPWIVWRRLAHAVEGGRTACVIVAPDPLWRSARGITLTLQPATPAGRWAGVHPRTRLFQGLTVRAALRGPAAGRSTEEVTLAIDMPVDRLGG